MKIRVIALAFVALAVLFACKKNEAPNNTDTAITDTSATVVNATAVDTTPTGGTAVTATAVITDPDRDFVLHASAALLGELAIAKSADLMGVDVAVKAYAHLLANDLERTSNEIRDYATKHNVILPTEVEAQLVIQNDKLKAMSGKAFDEEFLKLIVAHHLAMIALFDAEAKVVTDADLKAWVAKVLPMLHSQLDKAHELQAKIPKMKY